MKTAHLKHLVNLQVSKSPLQMHLHQDQALRKGVLLRAHLVSQSLKQLPTVDSSHMITNFYLLTSVIGIQTIHQFTISSNKRVSEA